MVFGGIIVELEGLFFDFPLFVRKIVWVGNMEGFKITDESV